MDTVKLKDLETYVRDQPYPLERSRASDLFADVTLELADGTVSLGETVAQAQEDTFEAPADVVTAVQTHLPRRAVGEPFQSEGDA